MKFIVSGCCYGVCIIWFLKAGTSCHCVGCCYLEKKSFLCIDKWLMSNLLKQKTYLDWECRLKKEEMTNIFGLWQWRKMCYVRDEKGKCDLLRVIFKLFFYSLLEEEKHKCASNFFFKLFK